jgi:hypothetical protein
MRIDKIRRMIRDAVADEERTGRLAKAIKQVARQQGKKPTKQEVQNVVILAREYIEHVPLLLEQGTRAAKQMGLDKEMGQIVQELEHYWFEANDLIPDHLGLMGLLDDAYATLFLFQNLSDYCRNQFGRPLLPQDLTAANQGMRRLIGDPVVSILDQRVGITLANAMMQRLLDQVIGGGFAFPAAPDPIWGNASIDEIVTARLGAMGVV